MPQKLRALLARNRFYGGRNKAAIESQIDLRYARGSGEALVVVRLVLPKRPDVIEGALLEMEQVVAAHQFTVLDMLIEAADDRLIQAGRGQVDQVHRLRELAMLLGGDLAGDEDAEMPDALVQAVDDRLAGGDDLPLMLVEIENPVQSLLRRRDVVTPGTEHDDRRADLAQVHPHTLLGPQLTGRELVPDEQFVGDGLHLLGIQQYRAAPPFLELEKALCLRVDLGIDVVGFRPPGVRRMHPLEICNQVGAVEDTVAEVAGQRREPGAAQQAAEIAHRVLAAHTRPIGKRGSGQHNRPRQIRAQRRHHHDLPTRLAVSDQHRLAFSLGMTGNDLLDEARLGSADVGNGLPRHRFRQEPDEVARMPCLECDANLAVVLHASDSRSVTGARIENDKGPLALVDVGARGWHDSHQCIIDRALQLASIHHDLSREGQHMRCGLFGAFQVVVAPLTQHVEKQDRALTGIPPILLAGAERVPSERP